MNGRFDATTMMMLVAAVALLLLAATLAHYVGPACDAEPHHGSPTSMVA